MAVTITYDPGPGVSDTILRAMVKNEKIARKLKEAISKHLMSEGILDTSPEVAIQIDSGASFIKLTIDPSAQAPNMDEISVDQLTKTFNIEDYLFGEEIRLTKDDKGIESQGPDIKKIIEKVIIENVPKSKV